MTAVWKSLAGVLLGLLALAPLGAHARQLVYELQDLRLADDTLMTGQFTWTYVPGNFLGGTGQFSSLSIPHTSHDHNDLDANIDVGESIEITLPGSTHDDGVDIMLVLVQPLTPTSASFIDLSTSRYEIGGNGFHDGLFQSGRIAPAPEPGGAALMLAGLAMLGFAGRVGRSFV
ncbi:MAG: hypothetical protein HYZ20_16425 [Burkholderiales bacterium]|nr:hypothetical protein [Burkholderiales bacterium]